jgi:uncharacterized protein
VTGGRFLRFQTQEPSPCLFWLKLSRVIKPVHYGIANYAMTTFNHLKDAQELPEFYMKSNDEMVLWRLLRRVSDQVKVELDMGKLDKSSGIDSFSIKNINIRLDKEKRELVFQKGYDEVQISLDVLEKRPSRVFKEILCMM